MRPSNVALHVFVKAVEISSVGPLGSDRDARLVALLHQGRRRVDEHRQRQQRANDPNADRDAQRRRFAHPRTQRVHNRHVPVHATATTTTTNTQVSCPLDAV